MRICTSTQVCTRCEIRSAVRILFLSRGADFRTRERSRVSTERFPAATKVTEQCGVNIRRWLFHRAERIFECVTERSGCPPRQISRAPAERTIRRMVVTEWFILLRQQTAQNHGISPRYTVANSRKNNTIDRGDDTAVGKNDANKLEMIGKNNEKTFLLAQSCGAHRQALSRTSLQKEGKL